MMKKRNGERKRIEMTDSIRLDPEKRLCPMYDSESIAKYEVADRDKMGFRVLDNVTEEHIQ